MCMIIHRPSGVLVPDHVLSDAASRNRDGVGIMYYDHKSNSIVIRRSADSKEYLKWGEVFDPNIEVGIHFRLGTHGTNNIENVHPFVVRPWLALMHNGILDLRDPQDKLSDTAVLAHRVLPVIIREDRDIHTDPAFLATLELMAGSYNKFLLLDDRGNFEVINKGAWSRDSQNIMYSSLPVHLNGRVYKSPQQRTYSQWDEYGNWDGCYSGVSQRSGEFQAQWKFPRETNGTPTGAQGVAKAATSQLILPPGVRVDHDEHVIVKMLDDGYEITQSMLNKEIENLRMQFADIEDDDADVEQLALAWIEEGHRNDVEWAAKMKETA